MWPFKNGDTNTFTSRAIYLLSVFFLLLGRFRSSDRTLSHDNALVVVEFPSISLMPTDLDERERTWSLTKARHLWWGYSGMILRLKQHQSKAKKRRVEHKLGAVLVRSHKHTEHSEYQVADHKEVCLFSVHRPNIFIFRDKTFMVIWYLWYKSLIHVDIIHLLIDDLVD